MNPFILVDDEEKLKTCADDLRDCVDLAVDLETDGLDREFDNIVGISLCGHEDRAYYVSVLHKNSKNVKLSLAVEYLKPIIESKPTIIMHNAKFDRPFLQRAGVKINKFDDTLILAWLEDPDLAKPLGVGLKPTVKRHLNHTMIEIYDLFPHLKNKNGKITKKNKELINFSDLKSENALPYAADDSFRTRKLYYKLLPVKKKFEWVYRVEIGMVDAIQRLELEGLHIDEDLLLEFKEKSHKIKKRLESEIFKIVGKVFDVNSPAQVAKVIYEDLKLPVKKRTAKTNRPSTAADVIELYDNPVCEKIKEFKKVVKSESSYIDALLEGRHPKTGKVYYELLQFAAPTGRLASKAGIHGGVNSQNIPKEKDETPFPIRQALVAPKGYTWVKIDFSNIELRIAANLSREPVMVKAFLEGLDYHTYTATSIFGKSMSSITKDERHLAKTGNFNLLYAFDGKAFGAKFFKSIRKGESFYHKFYRGLPQLLRWKLDVAKKAHNEGYVDTYFGFRRKLHMFDAENASDYKQIHFGRKSAVNTKVQGSAAQVLKLAHIKVNKWIDQNNLEKEVIPVLSVHDEIDFFIKGEKGEPEFDERVHKLLKIMECHPKGWEVPIVCEAEIGKNFHAITDFVEKPPMEDKTDSVGEVSIKVNRNINRNLLIDVKEVVRLYDGGRTKLHFFEGDSDLGYGKSSIDYSIDFKRKLEAIQGVMEVSES